MSSKYSILGVFLLFAFIVAGQRFGLPHVKESAKTTAIGSVSQAGDGLARFFQHPETLLPGADHPTAPPQTETGLGTTRAKNQLAIPEKSPEDLPPDVQAIRKQLYAKPIANRNGDLMLARADAWIIEYIPTPQLFLVTIQKDPADTAKRNAEQWFLNAGLKQEDLCDLPVRFLLGSEDLRRTNITFTSLPNGCE